MKKFAVPLVLLCCLTAAQAQSPEGTDDELQTKAAESTCPPNIYTVLLELRAVESRLQAAVSQVEELRKLIIERPKIAFSASLGANGNVGPFNVQITLIYTVIFTNIGNAYNPQTGIFTAPVRGVYYFGFFTHSSGVGDCVVRLFKNGELIVSAYESQSGEINENASNGASVLMEVGEQVYLRLDAHTFVFDDPRHASTFSGHLLFPL